ncbi:hypothetical protein [Halorussus lipolyticus]|uniref:hypothetical protein n=1 Tax=Halorussus lipolyticus TaxID=3034024 RepID=UPI0023E782BF|nr:hypothetical protein [Halorussus sp. DT80]
MSNAVSCNRLRTAPLRNRPETAVHTLPNRLRSLRTTFADQRDAARLASLGRRKTNHVFRALVRFAHEDSGLRSSSLARSGATRESRRHAPV